ncbi:hypothetical protein L2E82_24337 [Cichorium intybus]|uniref:Uncharacterized protein n=1 Tax=Cichorium intybus TaxID=13427 RepID=A0ACB9E1C5_CICIN|nr:hypothetical protein L2E82_24337 [Cichorium intybus]
MRGNMKMGVSEGSARIEEAAAIDLQGTINDMKISKYSDEESRMALGITEEEMEEIFGDNEVVPETQVTMDVEDAPFSNTQVATTEDVLVDVPMSMMDELWMMVQPYMNQQDPYYPEVPMVNPQVEEVPVQQEEIENEEEPEEEMEEDPEEEPEEEMEEDREEDPEEKWRRITILW